MIYSSMKLVLNRLLSRSSKSYIHVLGLDKIFFLRFGDIFFKVTNPGSTLDANSSFVLFVLILLLIKARMEKMHGPKTSSARHEPFFEEDLWVQDTLAWRNA